MNFSSSIRINKTGLFCLMGLTIIIVIIYRNSSSSSYSPENGNKNEDLISLKELLSAAIDAAKRGGIEVRRVREEATLNMQSKGETKEGVNDPVTDGDTKSHNVMYYSLHKSFPSVEIISEEHDSKAAAGLTVAPAFRRDPHIEKEVDTDSIEYTRDIKVWIDPLDATKEYTEDLREYVTTMVGVAVKGIPVIGVIHRPFSNTTHWGWLDHGLSADLMDIQQKPVASATGAPRIIVSISHQGAVKDVATSAFGPNTTIIPAAGAGYKILEIIAGRADAYVHTTAIKKWDLCAGHAILRAMGGKLTSLTENVEVTYGDRNLFKVESGLLATLTSHKLYLDKLQKLAQLT